MRIFNLVVTRVSIQDLNEQSCLSVFTAAMTVSTQAILMSVKNVMLCESAMGLLLSTLRVLGNTYFLTPTHRGLGETLMQQFEQTLAEKVLPAIGKVASEDEMPGRSLALVEEIVLCLTTYGTSQEKALALLGVISDAVV